jgi:hypothetical protein
MSAIDRKKIKFKVPYRRPGETYKNNDSYIKIEDAYLELQPHVFAYWIRLMTLKRHQLIGRTRLAKTMGLKLSRSNKALRELKLVDYIDYKNNGPGRESEIIILKRAAIVGFNRFVKL